MTDFAALSSRDAWATIRGYVYQVNLTILQWLALREDQLLELEKGEDIDLVTNAIEGVTLGEARLLQQVKHREESLTLRAPEVAEALVHFLEHRRANPDVDLRFRYITNAKVGLERPPMVPDRKPALQVWQGISNGTTPETDKPSALDSIGVALKHISRPAGLDEKTWSSWQSFVATSTAEEISDFIVRVEWATLAESCDQLDLGIWKSLIEQGLALSEVDARIKHEKLFLSVFKLLSLPIIKRLTASGLRAELQVETSGTDSTLLAIIKNLFDQLDQRVVTLESRMGELGQQVNALMIQCVERTVDYSLPPMIEVPPSVTYLSFRSATLERFVDHMQGGSSWLSLYGDVGCFFPHYLT